jgi:hypothetical protein
MDKPTKHPKVDQSLQYRWGLVGLVLVALLGMWYTRNNVGKNSFMEQSESTRNLEKIACPRCGNDPIKKKDCSLCGSLGFIWVDTSLDRTNSNSAP